MTTYQRLVKKHGYVEGLVGVNEDGEYAMVTIDKECATIATVQDNSWTRINVYYPDGTEEELYRK